LKVASVEEMRELDKKAFEKFGIKEEILMENAAGAVYFAILGEIGVKGKNFVIFSGPGNNGGDGLALARKLYSSKGDVKVYLLSEPEKFKGASRTNYEILLKIGIKIEDIKEDALEEIKKDVEKADLVIDAIFGTGLKKEVEGRYADIINLVNSHARKVLSIDIPSGINGDTGKIMGVCIKADYTVSFGLPKIGNILYPGFEKCGKLHISHISFPRHHYERDKIKVEINEPLKLPERDKQGHKGTFGDVLFIAGARGYYGAPYFSSLSFLKAGGGYSRLATPKSVTPFIGTKGSEVVFLPLEETDEGSIALENKGKILEVAEKVDMVVLGCGISLNKESRELTLELTESIEKPLLIDGDGITAISEKIDTVRERKSPTILTPHPGEMARITGKSIKEILDDKIGILKKTCKDLNAIIVLKGAHSLIGYPDERIFVNMSGNSGMATAGSGDVLTGVIAAMFGLGFRIEDAVRMGVFVHGLAGDIASKEKGEDGITAQDILNCLPFAIKLLREEFDKIKKEYEIPVV